jgi:hypothetical protein
MIRSRFAFVVGFASWAWACSGDPELGATVAGSDTSNGAGAGGTSSGDNPQAGGGGSFGFNDFPVNQAGSAGTGSDDYVEQNLIELRVEPADALLRVPIGESRTLAYKAYGRFAAEPEVEVELTERTVFYVPDNYLVAGFPASGAGTLTTRLPSASGDPSQRGGVLTVRAQAANTDGTVATATTTLNVSLEGGVTPELGSSEATPALPADLAAAFGGNSDDAYAPLLAYPNDGVLLPPNLGRLEVHFKPGSQPTTLYEIRFQGASTDLRYYTRCYADPAEFESGACAFTLTGDAFGALAASNQGSGPLTLSVRGTDEAGHVGASSEISIEFAAERIDGAVYYWTATNPPSIVRFDFGSGQSAPEVFVAPGDVPGPDDQANDKCVGCHALSRQGDKVFFSLDNSSRGELMYVNDLSRSLDDPDFFTYNGRQLDYPQAALEDRHNRVLTGSFDPTGSAFVAVAPKNDPESDGKLFFHDGATGERSGSLELPFTPSHPDWSPDGDRIAFTAIDTSALGKNATTIEFLGAGIGMVRRDDGVWDGANPVTIVPAEAGKNRYNPVFLPDGSALLYSESDQSSYSGSRVDSCNESNVTSNGSFCNGYSDPAAKTWAVLPEASATPVLLANAAAPGVADGLFSVPQSEVSSGDLMDTFPKPAPFSISHRGKTLNWFTVSSQRRAGLRKVFPNHNVVGDPDTQALLWMFALEPARIADAQDPSYAGFFLPFQALTTSNHMAQWTERIVSDDPPPPAPTPPPPPPPPPPPAPPPVILR